MKTPPFLPADAGLLVLQAETLLKPVYTSASIHKLLLPGEERMAFGTNFHADILLGGTGVDHIPASAGNGCILILGMEILLHLCHLFQRSHTLTD